MQGPETTYDLLEALRALPRIDLDSKRAKRIRDLAEAFLARRKRRKEPPLVFLAFVSLRVAESLVCGALSLGFVAWVLVESVTVLMQVEGGFFRH